MKDIRITLTRWVACLTTLLFFAGVTLAGPPLLCERIEIGSEKSLPWSSSSWNITGEEKYDVNHMETLRRATIYAQHKPAIAKELLAKLEARTYDKPQDALAAFDFGYLSECYKQMSWLFQYADSLKATPEHRVGFDAAKNVDGYGWVKKAIHLSGQNAEMEFAAALIATDGIKGERQEHVQMARAGAKDNPMLARNLEKRFPNKTALAR